MLLFVVMAKQIPKNNGTKPNPKNEVAAGAPMVKGVVWGGVKPTAAFTAKGQSATGLAKGGPRIPSMSGKGSKGAFAGSGASVAQGFALSQPTKPSNVINALLAVTALPGSGQVRNAVAKKFGSFAGKAAENASWDAAAKGLFKDGMGGKLKMSETVTGKQLTSTAIGSEAQQTARMNNLVRNADRIAGRSGAGTATKVVSKVVKTSNKIGQTVRNVEVAGAAAVVAKKTAPKNKSKNNSR